MSYKFKTRLEEVIGDRLCKDQILVETPARAINEEMSKRIKNLAVKRTVNKIDKLDTEILYTFEDNTFLRVLV